MFFLLYFYYISFSLISLVYFNLFFYFLLIDQSLKLKILILNYKLNTILVGLTLYSLFNTYMWLCALACIFSKTFTIWSIRVAIWVYNTIIRHEHDTIFCMLALKKKIVGVEIGLICLT